ncbi:hypothetical protein BDF19DRAFT_260535 [Syncephalis fuscata]|nr:hypothetical protein BDF19DRAFT_260535 [Syncephalis fuscata]
MYAQQVGHPSPVSPLEQLSHLQTPPEVSNDDNNIYGTSEISDADTIALQQMLQAAAAAMSAAKDATSLSMVNSQSLASASTTAATTHSIPATPALTALSSSSPAAATSVANASAAALQLLASQSQASSQSANALLAGAYATPDTASSMLSNDPFGQGANSPATALAMQELLASQLFPPLAPASTSSAAQSPCLSQPSQMTSPFVAFSSPDIFNTDTLALFGQNINNPLFTDYRDTSSLSALLSEPVEAPVPGANGQPLVFDDTANSLPSAAIVPLEGLTGMESPVNLNDTTQHHVAASVADERKLEEYCASGVLSEDDLDFLCSEMKTKCRAAKEAAVAKLEQLKREHAEQEKRVAHALLMSTQLDAINSTTTPPLP